MASPFLLTAIKNASGRVVYRQGGRFISQNKFESESRRVETSARTAAGAFRNTRDNFSVANVASQLQAEIGPPIGGGNWMARVRMSTEKFVDMLADDNLV